MECGMWNVGCGVTATELLDWWLLPAPKQKGESAACLVAVIFSFSLASAGGHKGERKEQLLLLVVVVVLNNTVSASHPAAWKCHV